MVRRLKKGRTNCINICDSWELIWAWQRKCYIIIRTQTAEALKYQIDYLADTSNTRIVPAQCNIFISTVWWKCDSWPSLYHALRASDRRRSFNSHKIHFCFPAQISEIFICLASALTLRIEALIRETIWVLLGEVYYLCSHINILWPIDVLWHERTWSTLIRVMALCLTAPNPHLN